MSGLALTDEDQAAADIAAKAAAEAEEKRRKKKEKLVKKKRAAALSFGDDAGISRPIPHPAALRKPKLLPWKVTLYEASWCL